MSAVDNLKCYNCVESIPALQKLRRKQKHAHNIAIKVGTAVVELLMDPDDYVEDLWYYDCVESITILKTKANSGKQAKNAYNQ